MDQYEALKLKLETLFIIFRGSQFGHYFYYISYLYNLFYSIDVIERFISIVV